MLYLYHHNSSVCAAKIRIAFAEKALTWEGEMIDLNAGDQFKPDYVKLNPKSVVPTLIHDGHVVIESNIILEYLEDAFPNPSLRPSAATDRAQMRLWLQRLDNGASGIHHAISVISYGASYRYQLMDLFGTNPDDLDRAVTETVNPNSQEWLREVVRNGFESKTFQDCVRRMDGLLADFETVLAANAWLSGSDYSLAEVAYTPYMTRLEIMNFAGMWERRTQVTDWFERIKARPSFTEVIDRYRSDFLAVLSERGRDAWPALERILSQR